MNIILEIVNFIIGSEKEKINPNMKNYREDHGMAQIFYG